MNQDDIIAQATPPGLSHVLTSFLGILALVGYFIGLQPVIIGFAGVASFMMMFNDDDSIFVYSDRFIISKRNYFGKLMAIDKVYYFQNISSFKSEIDKLRPNFQQTFIVLLVTIFLPRGLRFGPYKQPQLHMTISHIKDGLPLQEEVSISYSGKIYEIVLQKIEDTIKNQKGPRYKARPANSR